MHDGHFGSCGKQFTQRVRKIVEATHSLSVGHLYHPVREMAKKERLYANEKE
jgi:hypothetical protein